jgi:hypothetical protein
MCILRVDVFLCLSIFVFVCTLYVMVVKDLIQLYLAGIVSCTVKYNRTGYQVFKYTKFHFQHVMRLNPRVQRQRKMMKYSHNLYREKTFIYSSISHK